jgi:hypothetical protein
MQLGTLLARICIGKWSRFVEPELEDLSLNSKEDRLV